MPGAIDFYFDFISPYGYFASTRIDAIGERHGRAVAWHPFLVGHTVTKIMGMKPLMETPLKADYLRIDKPRMAALLGVAFVQPDMRAASSVVAARAFYWMADAEPSRAKAFARRVLHRLWVAGQEITSEEAVVAEAVAVGADGEALREALAGTELKQRLRDEVDACVARGVFGSPFFIVDEQPIFGVDRLWMLEHWLAHGEWKALPG